MKEEGLLTVGVGGIIAIATYLLGGLDNLLAAFALFLVLDYITGVAAAAYRKEIRSRDGFVGIGRKIAMFTFVIVAHQLDIVSGNSQGFIRDAIVLFLIGTEGISVMENCGKLGLPVPPFLLTTLDRVKNKQPEKEAK